MKFHLKQRIINAMRLTFFVLAVLMSLSLLFPALASNAQVLHRKVSYSAQNKPLEDVLKEIQHKYQVYFAYDSGLLKKFMVKDLTAKDEKLEIVLQRAFKPFPLSFEVINKIVVVNEAETGTPARKTMVQNPPRLSGQVIDENGLFLPGATIKILELGRTLKTDENGNFSLELPAGSYTIEASFISYQQQQITDVELKDGETTVQNFSLLPALNDLAEVVVVGYGTRKKEDLTGSVATVSSNQIKDLPVASVDQKMVGQMAGVQITSPTGRPGGGTTIKVRGAGSIGAGDNPLYVIDGFAISNTTGQSYNPLNVISPDDIESISVLKDASSTAIYGSRGSNGVVMITTKRGKQGAPVISLNTYYGAQQVPMRGRPGVLNGEEYARFRKEMIEDAFAASGETATEADIPLEFRNPQQYGAGTDWYDEILRSAPQSNIDLSIRGGSENTTYSFSAGRLEQQGTVRYTDYTRYTLQGNVQSKIGKRLNVGLSIAPGGGIQRNHGFESGQRDVLTRTLWLSPIVPVNDGSGNRSPFIISPGAIGAGNPLNTLEFSSTKNTFFRGLASSFAELTILDGLKAKYAFNVDYTMNRSFFFNPSFVYGETANANPNPTVPNSNTGNSNNFNWLSELTLNYDKSFGNDHRLNVLVGYTAQQERGETYGFNAVNYPDDLIQTINASPLLNGQTAGVEKWALLSYLARAEYAFKNRYIFTGTIRTDGSSRFGANVRYGTFPSGGFAWRANEESFLQQAEWLSNLKLRGSYGLAGNFNIGNYAYAASISTANYAFGNNLASGRVSNSISNVQLSWENSRQVDIGVDLGVMDNRFNLTVDYYNRVTTDMLFDNEIPLASGFSTALVNLGKVRNRGVEVTLNTVNMSGPFNWTTNFNISFNRNKVLELNQDNAPIYAGRSGEGNFTHKTEVGKPLGQFFGYIVEGVYMDEDDFNNSPRNASSVIGSIKYRDVDGNGIIEPVQDFAVIGSPYPDFTYGLTNNFSFKGFDMSLLIVGSQGGQIMKTANEFLTNIDGVFNVDRKILNRWRSPENPGDGITPTTNGGRVLYRDVNSSWVEDASFLRIQNVTLGYNFDQSLLGRTGVFKSIRVYGSVQNLVTFTNYSGGNPEALTNNSGVLTPGRDFLSYPLARTWTMGLNMIF